LTTRKYLKGKTRTLILPNMFPFHCTQRVAFPLHNRYNTIDATEPTFCLPKHKVRLIHLNGKRLLGREISMIHFQANNLPPVTNEEMLRIYETIKTPHKLGPVIKWDNDFTDSPTVFRQGDVPV
jgi:hypothetical protein